MATSVIMPALDMGQETGILISWLKHEGEAVTAGEPLMEIETDKAVVEVEASASGVLAGVTAEEGDEVPVGHVMALILAPGETVPPPPSRGRVGEGGRDPSSASQTASVGTPPSPSPSPIEGEGKTL